MLIVDVLPVYRSCQHVTFRNFDLNLSLVFSFQECALLPRTTGIMQCDDMKQITLSKKVYGVVMAHMTWLWMSASRARVLDTS